MSDDSAAFKSQNGYFQNNRSEMKIYVPENSVRILEVGCSSGYFCELLKQPDREIWGIEIDKAAAQQAKLRCDKVLIGNFDNVFDELPKNYFDCVIFNDVLEHIYFPWDTIRLVKEILTSNGVIVSSIPNFRYIANLITEILWEGEFRYKPEGGILDDTHIRFFTTKSIQRMYNEQGFQIVKHEGIHPCKSWKEKVFINLSFGLLKDARYKQFATVAKPIK